MTATGSTARFVLRTLRNRKPILVRNSLFPDGRKEPLSSQTESVYKWYSCGPTVYDDAHLGHARAYVTFDIIRRIIASLTGTRIDYALGVTDIDDKILSRATERRVSPRLLARHYETRFFEDMRTLNVLPPTRILRVTEHVRELQRFIEDLINNGTAYEASSGNVYFVVSSRGERYLQMEPPRNNLSYETNSSRIEGQDLTGPQSEKRDRRDFALWKRSTSEVPDHQWDSPWGNGRPGWHIECSAMAMAALGSHLDMHTGGIDLRFPHHTNELATAEAKLCIHSSTCSGDHTMSRWSHTWLHAGHLHLQGRKMSKSVKNFITIREYLDNDGTADAFRIFCLLHKYSSPSEYTDERLADAQSFLARIRTFLQRDMFSDSFVQKNLEDDSHAPSMRSNCDTASSLRNEILRAEEEIEDALADDFDTPRAMSRIAQLVKAGNSSLSGEGTPQSGAAALAYDSAGRLVRQTLETFGVTSGSLSARHSLASRGEAAERMDRMTELLVMFRRSVRNAARRKDIGSLFQLCDVARDDLRSGFGIRIADKKDGSSSWAKE